MTTKKAYIATGDVTAQAQIVGVDSRWINSDELVIGYTGTGTLRVSAGSVVNTIGTIAAFENSVGTVFVADDGYWSNNGDLLVGQRGTGTLNITGVDHIGRLTSGGR